VGGGGAGVEEHVEHPLQIVQELITVLQVKPNWSNPSQVLPRQLSEHPSAVEVGDGFGAGVNVAGVGVGHEGQKLQSHP
jgi:hypothetical protein